MVTFRNDDINANTDFYNLGEMYAVIRELFPECNIWSCVTMFCRTNDKGSVYNQVPFKNKPTEWFYDTNRITCYDKALDDTVIVSHGLFHIDHTQIGRDAQEMSILGSCKFLDTSLFVPPFNRSDESMEEICDNNSIDLVHKDEGWKSLEFEPFDPSHEFWYFHSWRFTPQKLKRVLLGKRRDLGQLRTDTTEDTGQV